MFLKYMSLKKQEFILPQIGIGQGGQQNIKLKNINLYYLGKASGLQTPESLPKISILCGAGRPPEFYTTSDRHWPGQATKHEF